MVLRLNQASSDLPSAAISKPLDKEPNGALSGTLPIAFLS